METIYDGSHIYRNAATGEAMFETFSPSSRLPRACDGYEWVTAHRHLADINTPGTPAYTWARR